MMQPDPHQSPIQQVSARSLPCLESIEPFHDTHSFSDHGSHQQDVWEELWENGNIYDSYKEVAAYINSLPSPLTLYRAVSAPDIEAIRNGVSLIQRKKYKAMPYSQQYFSPQGFGACWASEPECASPYYGEGRPERKHGVYEFRGQVQDDDVNWEETIFLMMVSAAEYEFRLNEDSRVLITGFRKKGEETWQRPPNRLRVVRT